ncbi:MAG: sugar phosphate isomerase/epimerase [Verrucomicrobiota bacterium]|jgi:sugar phosphate isomerase/epimerase|nr:sugar phosphate isomerase/epimerase [Verrucomicrobiota bacterium]
MNRRCFVKSALGLAGLLALGSAPSTASAAPVRKALPFRMGCAGYTFVKYDLETALQMMKRLDIRYMSLKDFHLPINADAEKIAEVLALFKKYGVSPYAVGPIYMNSEAEVKNAFAYAKRVGVKMIVAIPKYELLPLVDELVKEYDFKVAIHIHGPDTQLFPDATDVWKHIEKLDSRIGICYDIAHTVRTGVDLIEDYKKYSSRIYDMHIRDVTQANKSGHCIEAGRGIIDFRPFFAAITEANYTGVCSVEYEKDMSDILPGLAETVGYFNAILNYL